MAARLGMKRSPGVLRTRGVPADLRGVQEGRGVDTLGGVEGYLGEEKLLYDISVGFLQLRE